MIEFWNKENRPILGLIMNKTTIMLYGANGFTAGIMLPKLKVLSCKIILAGRNKEAIALIAKKYGYETRIFDLDHAQIVEKNLQDCGLLLNCAGPFTKTAWPLASACVKVRCHYFDITGELSVFQSLFSLNEAARAAKVSIIPGMGFDIVPSDCLAKMLAEQLPDASSIMIAISTKNTRASHGTMKTLFLNIGMMSLASRNGVGIEPVAKDDTHRNVTFNGRTIMCMRAPLADLFCTPKSTGIEHVDTYLAMPKQFERIVPIVNIVRNLAQRPALNKLFAKAIELLPNGPTAAQQQKGCAYIYGEARTNDNRIARAQLRTHEPYVYTGDALIKGAERFLREGLACGFQTPSLAFGSHFAVEVDPASTRLEFIKCFEKGTSLQL